jgi:hypothetical protein
MSFDQRDIRPAMDVYTLDNVYLGPVLNVTPGGQPPVKGKIEPSARPSSAINGELLGPMPTLPIGNKGPQTQSASELYATQPASAQPLGGGTITVGNWWGLVNRRTIPLDAVQTVSLERVVLKLRSDELNRIAG